MSNRRSLVFLIIIAILFVAVMLYFTPWITPVELVLDAVKIDDEGNELGTVQITISGSKLDYLFKPSRIDVRIHPFDGIHYLFPDDFHTKSGVITGMINSRPLREYLYTYYGGVNETGQNIIWVTLGFSPDMKQWIIRDDTNHVSYLASLDGTYTTKELFDYFNGLT